MIMGDWFETPEEQLIEARIKDDVGVSADAVATTVAADVTADLVAPLAALTTNGTFTTPTLSGVVKLTSQTVGTTAPSAGAGDALPATPAGYLTVTLNGVAHKIAYY